MATADLSPLHRQLTRVSRRLFLQSFLVRLAWCWAGALGLAAAWFVAQTLWWPGLSPEVRLGAPAGVLVLGTILAAVLAVLQAPSKVTAALLLDEKFGLKERVTTSLTLAPGQEALPAAQALLADVNARVDRLDVGTGFPLRVSWKSTLAPTAAGLLALAAYYFQPPPTQARPGSPEDLAKPPVNAAQIEEKVNKLKKKEPEKKPTVRVASEDLKRIEAELDQIANKPRDNKEQLRERIKEMTALEDAIKHREKDLAEKSKSLQQQLKQMERMSNKEGSQEGPAKDLQKALAQGKLDEAKDELDKLAKKLKNNELTVKEKEQLAKQLQNIQQKMERLAQQKDKEDKLQQLRREGKIDQETFKREMEQLKQQAKKSQDVQELAKKLGQCQQCLKQGDGKGAAKNLEEATSQLEGMSGKEKELEELSEKLQQLQDAKDSMCQGCGEGQNEGNGMGSGDRPGGKRPVGDKTAINTFDAKGKTAFDPKGKKIFDGYAPGQNFKKRTSVEIEGEIKQASQEAPEAIEQQRIPKSARDVAKGYFRNLGGQKEPAGKDKP